MYAICNLFTDIKFKIDLGKPGFSQQKNTYFLGLKIPSSDDERKRKAMFSKNVSE